MLRVFETEPGLITHLVRLFEWAQPCADLPAVLGAGALSETSLGDLDEALKLAEAPDLLKRTIEGERVREMTLDRKSTRLNSSHANISYAVFCLKKKKIKKSNKQY